jgi:hypothetical protein
MLDRPTATADAMIDKPLAPRPRDLRLDFFRGITMFIIFLAHGAGNTWTWYIPAHFGFSSGAELFVFCSGIASGMAFGALFVKRGFWLGSMRVVYRVWQVYWAHIGLSLVILGSFMGLTLLTGRPYHEDVSGWLVANKPIEAIVGLMTLRYFPAYMDILPMYILLLLAIPLMMLLRRLHPLAPFVASVSLWLYVQIANLWFAGQGLPPLHFYATPDHALKWHFNPAAWQMIFFTGFAFSLKWLKVPAFRIGPLFWLCVAYLVFGFFASSWIPMYWESYARTGVWWVNPNDRWHSALWDFKEWLFFGRPGGGVTEMQVWRYIHILAAAYVVLTLIDPVKDRLASKAFRPFIMVGQQSLATFLASTALAVMAATALEYFGRTAGTQALVNLLGFACILLVAYLAKSFKAQPWRGPKVASTGGAAPTSE